VFHDVFRVFSRKRSGGSYLVFWATKCGLAWEGFFFLSESRALSVPFVLWPWSGRLSKRSMVAMVDEEIRPFNFAALIPVPLAIFSRNFLGSTTNSSFRRFPRWPVLFFPRASTLSLLETLFLLHRHAQKFLRAR